MQSLLTWIIFGAVTGTLVNILDPSPKKDGILAAVVSGVAGALVGGVIATMVAEDFKAGINIPSFVIALIGASVLAYLSRVLRQG